MGEWVVKPHHVMKKIAIPLIHVVFLDPRIVIKNRLVSIPEGIAAAIIFCIGFTPITALAFALMGICSLSFASLILVVPAIILALSLGCYHRDYGKLMRRGYLMGIIAVACYDCVRIPFTMMGWMISFQKSAACFWGMEIHTSSSAIFGAIWGMAEGWAWRSFVAMHCFGIGFCCFGC
jgi:uncharacterized membrane protein